MWKTFLKGLLAAAIGGATGALATAISDPEHAGSLKKLGTTAGVGAIIAVGGYLKQSPLVQPSPPPPPSA